MAVFPRPVQIETLVVDMFDDRHTVAPPSKGWNQAFQYRRFAGARVTNEGNNWERDLGLRFRNASTHALFRHGHLFPAGAEPSKLRPRFVLCRIS